VYVVKSKKDLFTYLHVFLHDMMYVQVSLDT
jgi:hypothetical protein